MRPAMLKQFDPVDYSVVVKLNRKPANSWRWEIHCAGKSTPVCKLSAHFTTMSSATKAGKAALKEFLEIF